MISVAPTITDAGKNLLLRAVSGETITFTRFKIGNGEQSDIAAADLKDLINPIIEFPIRDIDTSETGYVRLSGKFDSSHITSDFRWRELGIFCQDEDEKEVLYAYANDGDNAGMLKANATDVVTEQTVALVIAIGEAENVTAILSESVLYAPKNEFDSHVANKENPHRVTKQQVELGNVPNVSTNNQTPTYSVPSVESDLISGETLGIAFGKIAKAVKSLIAHLKNTNNPHNLTPSSIKAASAEHTHGAAAITSGILGVARGGTGASTYAGIRSNIGLGSSIGVLGVAYGGTGVTSLTGSDYTTSRVRGISIQASVPSSISNGCIVGTY